MASLVVVVSFKWGKKKKPHDGVLGEYGGRGKTVTFCFASSAWTNTGVMCRGVVMQ
jgi:hypothetical protein